MSLARPELFGGSPKGGFQKGGFGGCPPGTKTGTRVHSPKPPFWKPLFYLPVSLFGVDKRVVSKRVVLADVPPERKPERGHIRQNHPFTKPPFYLPVNYMSLGRLQGIPTTRFLYVIFLYGFSLHTEKGAVRCEGLDRTLSVVLKSIEPFSGAKRGFDRTFWSSIEPFGGFIAPSLSGSGHRFKIWPEGSNLRA